MRREGRWSVAHRSSRRSLIWCGWGWGRRRRWHVVFRLSDRRCSDRGRGDLRPLLKRQQTRRAWALTQHEPVSHRTIPIPSVLTFPQRKRDPLLLRLGGQRSGGGLLLLVLSCCIVERRFGRQGKSLSSSCGESKVGHASRLIEDLKKQTKRG